MNTIIQTKNILDKVSARYFTSMDALFVAVGVALTFTIFVVGRSMAAGKLALPPTWDDVVYFIDAIERLEVFHEGGFTALWQGFQSAPPHSPLSTATAILGFELLGANVWAPYVFNGFILALFLSVFFFAARMLPACVSISLAVILLTHPFPGILILDFRPDMVCGLLTACGTLALIWGPWAEGDRRAIALVGALLGGALLSKPPVIHVTLVLFGLAMILASAPRLREPESRINIIRAILATCGIATIIALPYYVFAWRHVWDYIYTNVFGSNAQIWNLKISLFEHATYYLTGVGGRLATGRWLFVWLLGAIATVILAKASVRAKVWRTAAIITACYLIVSIPAYKSAWIGISLSAYFLVTLACMMVIASRYLLERRQTAVLAGALIVLAFGGISDFDLAARPKEQITATHAYAREQWRMLNEVTDAIVRAPTKGPIIQTAVWYYMNLQTISYSLWQRGVTPPPVIDLHPIGVPEAYRKRLGEAAIAIAFNPTSTFLTFLPSSAVVSSFLNDLRTDPSFSLLASVKDDKGAEAVYVFMRN